MNYEFPKQSTNINPMNCQIVESPAIKVTVTISRHQIWKNFVECWADMAWDEYGGTKLAFLRETAEILLNGSPISTIEDKLRKLFRSGHTVLFMGDAMGALDRANNTNILREIIITDPITEDSNRREILVIPHEDIVF